jgi:F-type H+-transporting ATPase subunit a
MIRFRITRLLVIITLIFSTFVPVLAQDNEHHEGETTTAESGKEKEGFGMGEMIMHHIKDEHGWEFAHGLKLHLPVILYTADRGLEVFSSENLEEGRTHKNYHIDHADGKIHRLDAAGKPVEGIAVYDFSITKNVASLFLSVALLLLIFTTVSRSFEKNRGRKPNGLQRFMEPLIIFIRDDVAKANIGPAYARFLPYLLTLFFFILINNLLGLLPGSANLTGNIAVTMVLAVVTFFVVNLSGNKHYWQHLVAPPGVPVWLLPLIIPIEVIGLFMKPLSLMIRLFANITAGHVIILSLLGLIFLANSLSGSVTAVGIAPVVLIFTLFLNLIELLVAFLQAYIFTLLTSMYIGSAVEDNHAMDHHGVDHDEVAHGAHKTIDMEPVA